MPEGTGIVVSRASRILPAIRSGHFATGSVKLLVLDEVASLEQLDEWGSVEPILETLGSDARKIAATGRPDSAFRQLLDRQLPRGRRWPEELLPIAGSEDEPGGAQESGPPVQVAVGPASERLVLLEACVSAAEDAGGTVSVVCTDPDEAVEAAAALAVSGREARAQGSEVRLNGGASDTGSAARILLGAPAGLAEFREALAGFSLRFVIVDPARLAHVEALARRAGMQVAQIGGALPTDPLDAVVGYRRQLEEALRATDFVPELLVLEPLIDRYGGARVAAALSALLRRGDWSSRPVVPWPDIEAASLGGTVRRDSRTRDTASRAEHRPDTGSGRERGTPATPRGARSAWTKLYFGIGRKDEIKPGDLVGAITGETGIVGGQIGKIEIRGGFSLVEIDSQVVDDVLRRLQGVTIRGQEVPVRPDRER